MPRPARPNTPSDALQKSAFNQRAKISLQRDLSARTWAEKIAAIRRLNEVDQRAKAAMQKFMAEKKTE
jgi:hypothetical protein